MKKYIMVVAAIVLTIIACDYLYYYSDINIDVLPEKEVTTFVKAQGSEILLDRGEGYEPFTVKGVNLGSGIPGEWSSDYAITEDTYLRWFKEIQAMGANTLRVYTVQDEAFYKAFYNYNKDNPKPLYLLHGVWVNDYVQNSHRDAYDVDFFDAFLQDARTMVDVVHGKKKITTGGENSAGSGTYTKDISPWVIGYVLGVEWEDATVIYTDKKYEDNEAYQGYRGAYLSTTREATPFETMLAKVGDTVISYESRRYGTQRLVAFTNWPTTDPFEYPQDITRYYKKCVTVDVEHITCGKKFLSGQFASYHAYPYYPDYLKFMDDWTSLGLGNKNQYINDKKELDTYKAYLALLNKHHTMPVVITEFGVSTGRGMAQRDDNTGRNQGHMSETEQGQALIDCYEDIMDTGSAGGCVFSWQDEWFKRSWNTMFAVDLSRTPYWSDYQTSNQYFGLLSFDPGDEESVCYVDGDVSEWGEEDVVAQNGDMALSMKYDEKFVYLKIKKDGLNLEKDALFIPIDTTPKTGSNYCENFSLKFDRDADFVLQLSGKKNSRLWVQERYEALRSTYSQGVYRFDTYLARYIPQKDSPTFTKINALLRSEVYIGDEGGDVDDKNFYTAETFETGLLTYGNANPKAKDYNSLADFCAKGDYIEVKLPWQLLNFADPSEMSIHDDYYDENYGVEYISIDEMHLGIGQKSSARISLATVPLEGWDNKVSYHERLKPSYEMLKDYWKED